MRPKRSPAQRQTRQNVPRLDAAPAVQRGSVSHGDHRELDGGLSLQRIWQDLVEEYGYGASYESFPALRNDDLQLTLVLEEGGRRLTGWELRSGRRLDEHSYRFAWTVVFNIARSWMLRDANRMQRDTIGAEAGDTILSTVAATTWGTPQQMEAAVRLREAYEGLTEDQRSICESKIVGYSAAEIASTRGCSADAVNMVFSRAKRKLRSLLGPLPIAAKGAAPGAATPDAVPESSVQHRGPKHADAQLAPDSSAFVAESEIDVALADAYPNPTREGCPSPDVIEARARRERAVDDPDWRHVFKCSPCYREVRALQQAAGERREGFEQPRGGGRLRQPPLPFWLWCWLVLGLL